MTIPAGSNWCPDCEEACHDHGSICTVCGATLVNPPPERRNVPSNPSVVAEWLSQEVRTSARELRSMLQNLQRRIEEVESQQATLMQNLDWQQQISIELLLDPSAAVPSDQPTSQEALTAIPRILLTANSAIFHQCTLQVSDLPDMPAIPGEFGVISDYSSIQNAVLIVAEPLTGSPRLSNSTLKQIQQATAGDKKSQRAAVVLYMLRGGNLTFAQKAIMAETAGASACIIGNHVTEPWPYTMKDSKGEGNRLEIPVVMVQKTHGQAIVASCSNATTECTLTIQKNNGSAAAPECCVCTDVFEPGNTVLKLPACGHYFHETCAVTWLSRHNTCPYCRSQLPLQDAEAERERRRRSSDTNVGGGAHNDFYG